MDSASNTQIHVLLVEDDPSFAQALKHALAWTEHASYMVVHAGTLARATETLTSMEFDVILLDLTLPDSEGMDTVRAVHEASPKTSIVVLTSLDDETLGREAIRCGAQDFLIKSQADDRLIARAMRYAIERRQALDERDRLIGQLRAALNRVKKLSGLLPICMHCKKIRDDQGYWNEVEKYVCENSEAQFSHGLCPECAARHYSEVFDDDGRPR